jgi:YidC/Oxa1 family membrane protein insertase
MSENKQSVQTRFILAAALSLLVLLGWSYFFAPKKTVVDNANANTAQNTTAAVTPTPTPTLLPAQNTPQTPLTAGADNAPGKTITIKSPLYQVKLDSKGALATSWILVKNVQNGRAKDLFANDSTEANPKPLELISPKGLETREVPFRLTTGDAALDGFLNDRNYDISVGDETVTLNESDTKEISFTLTDASSNTQVAKTFVFHGNSYVTDLGIKVIRNGQPVPNTKLGIGPSIGDQSIVAHNYYHIEPEAVDYVNGGPERHAATSFAEKNNGQLGIGGDVDWAGVGDTYFAMAAVPAQKVQGLELRSTKYDVDVQPFYDGIISWITRNPTTKVTNHLTTAYIPVVADGSKNLIYTGSKDYFTISGYNKVLSDGIGRPIDVEDFINYGWLKPITKPIAIPLLWCLNFIYGLVGSYGVAIIVFTLIFYSLFFPVRWWQSKSFKKAQANAPKMKDIQERMKELQRKGVPADDPRMRAIQMEQLKMTKDAIPIGGCLPLLFQMPLFIALYVAVTISLDFRQASFLWLPDLSASDPWHILNFLFAGSMAGSMILTPTAPAVTPEQQTQQKMMTYMMPIMMLWLMWGVPAGLLLYWFFGNIVSYVQQFIINRMNKSKTEPPQEIEVKPLGKKPKLSTT